MKTKEEILNEQHTVWTAELGTSSINPKEFPLAFKQAALNAMDYYMEQTCLELLTYMAQKGIICGKSDSGEDVFMVRSERGDISMLNKEELFKNFL
jgi:hypothetical protein